MSQPAHPGAREGALVDILTVMGRSSFDLSAVLSSIIENAVRLSQATSGSIVRVDSGRVGLPFVPSVISSFGLPDANDYHSQFVGRTLEPGRGTVVGRVLLEGRSIQIANTATEPGYEGSRVARTLLGVPLKLRDELVGILVVRREPPQQFERQQIGIVETFASQAAIAIDNVRLYDETRAALDRQAATSEVLKTMTRSPFELEAVFKAIVKGASRLARADNADLWQADGREFVLAAYAETEIHPVGTRFEGGFRFLGRVAASRGVIHIPDTSADPLGSTDTRAIWATRLGVPILSDGTVLGVISLGRIERRPFAGTEIELVTTFADQAAIAIENARLFATVKRQTDELSRFLSPQVARVITSEDGPRLLDGHRRQITVLFCDLRGFTAFSETAEPEEVFGVLREYHGAMGKLILAHGGTLEHFAGDGMMVFFNDPVAVEGHEAIAVRLSLEMRDRSAELAATWSRKGYELALGIGIATGYATLGRIGFEGRYDYGAVGNVVILAARLSSEAGPGQILISQRVHAVVEADIRSVPVGELSLKGMTRPIPAFDVLCLR